MRILVPYKQKREKRILLLIVSTIQTKAREADFWHVTNKRITSRVRDTFYTRSAIWAMASKKKVREANLGTLQTMNLDEVAKIRFSYFYFRVPKSVSRASEGC